MASVIQTATEKMEAMSNRLGVPCREEMKEELEDKLISLIEKIDSLVQDGTIAHKDRW